MIELDNITYFGFTSAEGPPVDLSAHVKSITVTHSDEVTGRTEWAAPITLRFHGRNMLTALGYQILFGETHPRIRRMHAAYGRRRGRGRW